MAGYYHGSRGAHRLAWYRPGPESGNTGNAAEQATSLALLTEDDAFLVLEDGSAFLAQES